MTTPTAGAAAPERTGGRASGQRVLVRELYRIEPGLTVVFVTSIVASGLMPVATMATTGLLVSSVANSVDASARWWGLALAGLFLMQLTLRQVHDNLASTLGRRLFASLRERVMAAHGAPPGIGHLDKPETAEVVAAARTAGSARYTAASGVEYGVGAGVQQVAGVASALVLGALRWWLPPVLLVIWLLVRRLILAEALEQMKVIGFQTAADRRSGYFRDLGLTAGAAKEVRVFGLADWLVGRFHAYWNQSISSVWEARRAARAPLRLIAPLALGSQGLVIGLLVVDALAGRVGVTRFVVLAQAALGLVQLGGAGRDDVVVEWGAATIPPVARLEEAVSALATADREQREAAAPGASIEFQRVSFRYPGQSGPVLDGLDLIVPVGQSTAIVGHNGAGKTTLVKLLCGVLEPDAGRIEVDGVDLRSFEHDSWLRRVAVVFQDFLRHPVSARDNVRFGSVESMPTEGDLREIARLADLDNIVAGLPAGWDTVLSRAYPHGCDLSGGEWQRIALARAMWSVENGASVLVLDEPTANLDVRAEARFFERFLDLTSGLTTVLISHRFSTVRRADNICVVDRGRLVEAGSHETLLANRGLYAAMFTAQADSFANEDHG